MNGRIYDADTGRFMQADPFVQAPTNLQNYNAYSYVLNNPLSYTDPSGYLFKKVHDFSKKIRRQVIRGASKVFGAQVVSIVGNILTAFCGPAQAACAAAWNYEFTRAMGGSVSQALKAGLTAAVTAGAGQSIGFQSYSAQFVFDGVVGGIMADVNGGNFGHGFWAAGLNRLLGGGGNYTQNPITNVVISAAVGGTISEVTGGKFRNGAYSAAFTSALRQDWNEMFAKRDNAGKFSLEKKVDVARKNLKAFKDAKEYVLKEYADLFDGIDIELTQINEKNIGEACWVESCIKVNFEKVVSGERRYMTSDFVETLVHEALHVRVIEEIGLFSYFLNHERAHHWIGRSGQGAGAYYRGPNIFDRPDISMNKFNSYMNGD